MIEAKKVSCTLGGRQLEISTGKYAKQAGGAVMVRYGDTVVMVTSTGGGPAKADFFPLTVEYSEKFYSAGKIPGGYFKREAKPTEKATLSARLTDRPIRPQFPDGFRNEVQVVITTLSIDEDQEPDFLGTIGASASLCLSDLPFNGPVAACRVARIDGELVINPTKAQREKKDLEILVAASKTAVVMVEGGAKEASEKDCLEAIYFAFDALQPVIKIQEELAKVAGKPKAEFEIYKVDSAFGDEVRKLIWNDLGKAFAISEKQQRYAALDAVKTTLTEKYPGGDTEDDEQKAKDALKVYEDLKYEYARTYTLKNKKRIDGRTYTSIRPIWTEVGILPRAHGSAVFTRGETQVLAVATLGTPDEAQRIDSIEGSVTKSFMLHYNFPPFSVGEVGRMGSPGRREIGHGALAERALAAVLPEQKDFPYTVRLVSEVLESNGSSSMGTVCSGSLALMDCGIPTKGPVAGIAMGLISEGQDMAILSDILGDEDHLGDMDFKVAGTNKGITAIQMDIKISGVTKDIMATALEQAREGRLHILEKMASSLNSARTEISPFAPRIETLKIKQDRIRDVIGSGGKVIRGLVETTGCKIEVQDDGTVLVASSDATKMALALKLIRDIVAEPEIGVVYKGKVKRIVDFGAFIEIIPNVEGLCHISELEHRRVATVSEVLREGQEVDVKVLEIDPSGKIRLSIKALKERPPKPEGGRHETSGPRH